MYKPPHPPFLSPPSVDDKNCRVHRGSQQQLTPVSSVTHHTRTMRPLPCRVPAHPCASAAASGPLQLSGISSRPPRPRKLPPENQAHAAPVWGTMLVRLPCSPARLSRLPCRGRHHSGPHPTWHCTTGCPGISTCASLRPLSMPSTPVSNTLSSAPPVLRSPHAVQLARWALCLAPPLPEHSSGLDASGR